MPGYINTKKWASNSGTTLQKELESMRYSGHNVLSAVPAADGNSALIVYESCLPQQKTMTEKIYNYRRTGCCLKS